MAVQNPAKFLKEVKVELDKVVWPARTEAIRLTTIVVAVSIMVGVFIGALDFVFTKVMEFTVR